MFVLSAYFKFSDKIQKKVYIFVLQILKQAYFFTNTCFPL